MALKDKIKEAVCSRKLEPGDTVKVLKGGDWAETDNVLGGMARWAIFVDTRRDKAVVRPLLPDGSTGPKTEVEKVEHIDDSIKDAAMREYREKRMAGRGR
jgi:hypothetical protein